MRRSRITSLVLIGMISFVMLNMPGNFWQSNPSENGFKEPLDVESKTPSIAYQPPIPFDPNVDFQFNTSERCGRTLGLSAWNTTGITIDTPSTYNSTFANITLRVRNYTTETWATSGSFSDYTNAVNYAQGFNITQNGTLVGFSIYNTGKAITSTTLSLRQDTPGGPILENFPVTMPIGGNNWYNVALNPSSHITAGHYYISYPSTSASLSQWCHTLAGSFFGDSYANGASVMYNLSLIIYMKNFIDPESVNMNVSNQPVKNMQNGTGWVNLTSAITGTSKTFTVSNSSPIEYSFSTQIICNRTSISINAVNLTNGDANWTLTALSYPGANYSVYQGNITGFNQNHTSVQAFLGENTIGFSRPPPYDTLIFTTAIDRISFLSTNYITQAEIPGEVHSNEDVDLNVTVGAMGNVSVTIYSDSGSVYQNKTYASGTTGFRWHVDTALAAGEYVFEATFFNPNQVGFFQQNITLAKVAAIDTYNLSVQALGNLQLNYRLFDLYGGSNIPYATINYYFTDLTGQLQYGITGNYTKSINLDTFSIQPGNYTLILEAIKTGYQSIQVSIPIKIITREISFEITRSATSLIAGSTLEVQVNPGEVLTGSSLLRPVDVTVKIYPMGGDADLDAIASGTLDSISSADALSLAIPAAVALGSYDILVRVDDMFYAGNLVLPGGLTIVEPPNIFFTILIAAGIVVLAVGSYVFRQQALSKRSVRGAIIMNPGGMPLARVISPDFSTMNPHLISGAVMGIVTMVKEMTGSAIRTIALEGRYLKIVLRDNFWLVLLLKRNPVWIGGTVKKLLEDIELRYGEEIAGWKGEGNLHISLDLSLKRWFGIEIEESREPELEMSGNLDSSQPPSPPGPN